MATSKITRDKKRSTKDKKSKKYKKSQSGGKAELQPTNLHRQI